MVKARKWMACLCALVLSLSFCVNAFAAPSPEYKAPEDLTADDIFDLSGADSRIEAATQDGKKVEITTSPVEQKYKEEAAAQAADLLAQAGIRAAKVAVLGAIDIKVADGTVVSAENPLTITVRLDGVKVGDTIVALHRNSETGQWEVIPCTVISDGVVQLTLTSLSPLVFLKVIEEGDTGTADGVAGTTVDTTAPGKSPKTGEGYEGMTAMVLGAVFLAGGIVLLTKKEREKA